MNKLSIALAIGFLGLTGEAAAHDSVGFSISFGNPVYVAPAPVYYAPPPVVYQPAPVVYYRPAPVYYGPTGFISFGEDRHFRGHHDRGFHRGWRHHDDD